MVCVPCIVVPFVLWVFHKYIRPFLIKIWNPFGILGKVEENKSEAKSDEMQNKSEHSEQNGVTKPTQNGIANGVANGAIKGGGPNKKDD